MSCFSVRVGRLSLLILCLFVGACGFRLAGTANLPQSISTIYLQTQDFNNRQRQELQNRLRAAGAELLSQPQPGSVSLRVFYKELADIRLVSSASSGATVERVSRGIDYSLRSAEGEILVARQSLLQTRDIALDDDNLLSSSEEKDRVLEELEEQLFDQLLRQLQRI